MTTGGDKCELVDAAEHEFVSFFFRKIAPSTSPENEDEMEFSKLTYRFTVPGVAGLFKMLEHVYINYKSADVRALWRIFYGLESKGTTFQKMHSYEFPAIAMDIPIHVRIPSENEIVLVYFPFEEYILIQKYRDIRRSCFHFQEMVKKCLIMKNVVLFSGMTRLGATIGKPGDTEDEWNFVKKTILILFGSTRKFLEKTLDRNIRRKFNSESRKRLYILAIGLEFMHDKEYSRTIDYYRQCYQRLFETTPEPRIRSCEIRDYLFKLLWPVNSGTSKFLTIQNIVKRYKRCFPDSDRPLTPRSLMHLCRCQVRENLWGTGNFLYHAARLKLPHRIKQYILLEKSFSGADSFFAEHEEMFYLELAVE